MTISGREFAVPASRCGIAATAFLPAPSFHSQFTSRCVILAPTRVGLIASIVEAAASRRLKRRYRSDRTGHEHTKEMPG